MRLLSTLLLAAIAHIVHAQVYVHPLAKSSSENSYSYRLNAEGQVVGDDFDHAYTYTAKRKNARKPFEIKMMTTDGRLVLYTFSEQPDPIYHRYADDVLKQYSDNSVKLTQAYKKGRPHGVLERFYASGNIQERAAFDQGLRSGSYASFYESGQVKVSGAYEKGKKVGTWVTYYADGSKQTETGYFRGEPVGAGLTRFQNGKVASSVTYDRLGRAGAYVRVYPSGTMAEKWSYANDLQTGLWEGFFENGDYRYKGSYDRGSRIGEWLEMRTPNDTLLAGRYVGGAFTGIVFAYDVQGSLIYKEYYHEGEATERGMFDASGNLVRQGKKEGGVWRYTCPNGATGDCSFWDMIPPSTDRNVEAELNEFLKLSIPKGMAWYEVLHVDLDPMGRVVGITSIGENTSIVRPFVRDYLASVSFGKSSYFGQPARYSTEVSIYLTERGTETRLGHFYLSDSALLSKAFVPYTVGNPYPNALEPEFEGGETALNTYIKEHLEYPDWALSNGISGESELTFTVEPSGVLSNIVISNNAHPALDYEALRMVRAMPLWKPVGKEGKEECSNYKLPLRFTLR